MTKAVSPRKSVSVTRPQFGRMIPRNMFEDLFEQFLTDRDTQLSDFVNAAMDLAETDQAFEVKMDLPGVSADEIDVQIVNNTLTVRGQRREEKEEKDEKKQFHRIERYAGNFARSVMLPNLVNEDETIAEFKDGVLKIVIPKADNAKPRRINIKS